MSRSLLYLLAFLISFSCKNSPKENQVADFDDVEMDIDSTPEQEEYVKKAKFIFYNMSSPIEMAQIFENSETDFNIELLYDHNYYLNYSSSKKIALIMGLYGVDLSYARMYNQTQRSVNYL